MRSLTRDVYSKMLHNITYTDSYGVLCNIGGVLFQTLSVIHTALKPSRFQRPAL